MLIEDVPNLSNYTSRNAFHVAIRNFASSARTKYPLVFIISDTADIVDDGFRNRESDRILNVRSILPPDILHGAFCTTIHFNPVAPSFLVKALARICDKEFGNLESEAKRPPKDYLDAIAQNCGGDIRCAINALQFLTIAKKDPSIPFLAPGKSKSKKKVSKVKLSETQLKERKLELDKMLECLSAREISSALYHALGKILYNKRTAIHIQ